MDWERAKSSNPNARGSIGQKHTTFVKEALAREAFGFCAPRVMDELRQRPYQNESGAIVTMSAFWNAPLLPLPELFTLPLEVVRSEPVSVAERPLFASSSDPQAQELDAVFAELLLAGGKSRPEE